MLLHTKQVLLPHLWYLGGFARPCFRDENHNLVLLNSLKDLLTEREDGQGGPVRCNLFSCTLGTVRTLFSFPLLGLLQPEHR